MKMFSQHLFIGDRKDAFNVLNGIDTSVDAVLDCTSDMPSSKWKAKNDVRLRKVGFDAESVTKQKLMKALDFITECHREHKKVLVASNKDDRTLLVLLAFLTMKKGYSVDESLNIVVESVNVNISPAFVDYLRKQEAKQTRNAI